MSRKSHHFHLNSFGMYWVVWWHGWWAFLPHLTSQSCRWSVLWWVYFTEYHNVESDCRLWMSLRTCWKNWKTAISLCEYEIAVFQFCLRTCWKNWKTAISYSHRVICPYGVEPTQRHGPLSNTESDLSKAIYQHGIEPIPGRLLTLGQTWIAT